MLVEQQGAAYIFEENIRRIYISMSICRVTSSFSRLVAKGYIRPSRVTDNTRRADIPDGRLRLLQNGRSVYLIFFTRSVGLCRRSIRRSIDGRSIDHTAVSHKARSFGYKTPNHHHFLDLVELYI